MLFGTLAFLALASISIALEFYWFLLLPMAMAVTTLALFRLDALLLLIAFLAPLSINLEEFGDFPVAMFLPTEPILFGILILFVVRSIRGKLVGRDILLHPISLVILLQLAWLLITSMTSHDPLVSFKFTVMRSWFLASFYFLGIHLFKKPKNMYRFIWLYGVGLSLVALYTMYNHSQNGFDHESAHWVMSPFFKDHTSYGAMLAFFLVLVSGFIFRVGKGANFKGFMWILISVLAMATVLSYTRAAWLSLVMAMGVLFLAFFRIRFRNVLMLLALIVGGFFAFQQEIIQELERNNQDAKGGLSEHVASITNISTDASNLERLNRWASAVRLFKERPVFGWGPGTYQFVYAPYQKPHEKTIISTNAGDVGNAHSEYIGPLAEQGFFGAFLMLALVFMVIRLGLKLYVDLEDREFRVLSLVLTMALTTYFVHGFLNNFLDTDKAAVPVWGCIAMLVSMDLYMRKRAIPERKNRFKEYIKKGRQ